jgi:biofilm PGA synthesis N-glycosyltransferase PgaC
VREKSSGVVRRVRSSCIAAGAYVQVGYPLILVLGARLRGSRSRPTPPGELTVSVLIAAWDEASVIVEKLRNTLRTDYPAHLLQIVVATDGSTDGTAEKVAGYGDARVVVSHHSDRAGKVRAINRALPLLTGEIVIFSDANNQYAPQTIPSLVARFADPTVGAVSGAKRTTVGPIELGFGEGLYWRYEDLIKRCEDQLASCTSASGEVLAVRRSLVGALPEQVGVDDFARILAVLRGGKRVSYEPAAVSHEPTSASLRDERDRRRRITAQRWRLLATPTVFPLRRPIVMWQIVSHKIGRLLLPFFALGALVANIAEVLLEVRPRHRRRSAVLLAAQVAFYGTAAVGPKLRLSGRAGKLVLLPRYLVEMNRATVEGLIAVIRGERHGQWAKASRHTST